MLNFLFSRIRFIFLVLISLSVAGIYSYVAIPKENLPEIQIPVLFVSANLANISPEDSERLLVVPIDAQLSRVSGVEREKSYARQGGAGFILVFNAGYDLKKAYEDVQRALDRVQSSLPPKTKPLQIQEINVQDFPIILAALTGNVNVGKLLKVATALKTQYEKIPQVLSVSILGDRQQVVEIILKPEVLKRYNINLSQVWQAFSSSNVLIMGGTQRSAKTGAFSIDVSGTFQKLKQILDFPIVQRGKKYVRLRDIASYRLNYKAPNDIARFNGARAIFLSIKGRSGENVLSTVSQVRAITYKARKLLPKDVSLHLAYDQSTPVRSNLKVLQNTLITAIFLIMLVVVAALGLRSGIIVGLSIPFTFLVSMLSIYLLGFSLNSVVLFGLVLSVGMVVDASIVVVEAADRRHSEGMERIESYKSAALRMAKPILASTATTLSVFVPLLFWPGVSGKFMLYIPATVICMLTVSFIAALLVTPILGVYFRRVVFPAFIYLLFILLPATVMGNFFGTIGIFGGGVIGLFLGYFFVRFYKKSVAKHRRATPPNNQQIDKISHAPISQFHKLTGLVGAYYSILAFSLKRPKIILFISCAILILSYVVYAFFGRGVILTPTAEPSYFKVNIYSPGNLSLSEKDHFVRRVEKTLFAINATRGEFKSLDTSVGGRGSLRANRRDKIGSINIGLVSWQKRRKFSIIQKELYAKLVSIKGIEVGINGAVQGDPHRAKPIEINVLCTARENCAASIANIKKAMISMGKFVDIATTLSTNRIKFNYIPNRSKASLYGVDMYTLGQTIRLVTSGAIVGNFHPNFTDKELDVIVQYPKKYRTLTGIKRLTVQTPKGPVPLSDLVARKVVKENDVLIRKQGKAVQTIDANVASGINSDAALKKLLRTIDSKHLLVGQSKIVLGGSVKQQQKSSSFALKAAVVAIVLVTIILLLEFDSFYSTLLVLTAAVFSTVGVLLGLVILRQPFSVIMSGVSVIALAGIVVNNNIILIDAFDAFKKTEKTIFDAVVRSAVLRLRPVLLTAGTTGLGLLPTAFGVSIDFVHRSVTIGAPSVVYWQLVSQNILSGLIFSSVLTLVFTPCALYVFYTWKQKKMKNA